MTDSILGGGTFSFGPSNLYFDTDSAGADIFLGFFDSLIFRWGVQKIPLVSAQTGSEPDDMAVSGHLAELELGLAQATLERLEQTVQGFVLERVVTVPKRFHGSSVIGQRDSSIRKQATLFNIVNGVESIAPLDIIDFWFLAPTATAEWTFDAATQRFVKVAFKAYRRDDKLDPNGAPTYFRSRLVP